MSTKRNIAPMRHAAPSATDRESGKERIAPRVSVIAIFLNAERYLDEAIRSVLAQDFKDLELLLVDDGSSDASTGVAIDYARRLPDLVRYLEHAGHVNRGMSASRNLGLCHALGEFVALIDADDVWEPNKLSEQVALMQAYPQLGMVCGAVRYWASWTGQKDEVRLTGAQHDKILLPPFASVTTYPLGSAHAPCPSDLLLRRDIVQSVGGFEEHFCGPRQMYEDQALLAKLYLRAPVYFASNVWLNYRQHPESCVATVKRDGLYDEVRLYFLLWFNAYLKQGMTEPHHDVQRLVRQAIWQSRWAPVGRQFGRCAALLARTLRKGLVLPKTIFRSRGI